MSLKQPNETRLVVKNRLAKDHYDFDIYTVVGMCVHDLACYYLPFLFYCHSTFLTNILKNVSLVDTFDIPVFI